MGRGLRDGAKPLMFAAVIAGVALSAVAGCVYPPARPGGRAVPTGYNADVVARTVLRIYGSDAHQVGVLDLTEMSAPDAPGPPYPRCIFRHAPAGRIVNFDLNYHPLSFGPGTAPAVHVTLAGPDGATLIAENHVRPNVTWTCAVVRSLFLSPEPPGWQLVYGLALQVPVRAALHELKVRVDGQLTTAQLNGTAYPVNLPR